MHFSRSSFIAATAALAAASAVGTAARAADSSVVTTGLIPADIGAAAEFARELGYFKDAGLDVEIEVMQSGPSIASAVVGGSLTIGAMNSGTLAGARLRGLPLLFLAPAAMTPPVSLANSIIVKADGPLHTGADFDGKTVGIVAVKTLEHAALLLWIDKHGGDSKSVKFTELPYSEMSPALQSGRIDAALASEPFATMSKGVTRVVAGAFAAMPGPFISYGYFATEAWLNANADAAQKYAAAIHRAAVWANGHKRESADMVATFTKLDPKIVETMARTDYATSFDPAAIQPAIDVMFKYGMLPSTIDAKALIWKGKV